MRILLVTHRYLPHSVGGVEVWTRSLARDLSAAGHDISILARDDRPRSPQEPFDLLEARDGPLTLLWLRHRLDLARSWRETWDDRRVEAAVDRALDMACPDVVHLAHVDGWGVTPLRAARRRGLVTGVTLHDYKAICARGQMLHPNGQRCAAVEPERCTRCVAAELGRGPLHGLVQRSPAGRLARGAQRSAPVTAAASRRWIARQRGLRLWLDDADVITAPSQWVIDRHAEAGFHSTIHLVRHGAPAQRTRQRRRRAPGPLRLGFFGTAVPSKGLGLLRRALSAISADSVELRVHGGARPGGLSGRAWFAGPYEPDDLSELLAPLDIVALPSRWAENAPLVAVAARAAGLPLLVSEAGGLPELVRDGVDGFVLPADDAEPWAEHLALLAATPDRCQALGAAGAPPPPQRSVADTYAALWRGAGSP